MAKSLSKIVTKAKAGIGQVTKLEGIPRVLTHLGIGFVFGVILQLFTEYLAYWISKAQGKPMPNLETGFSIYYNRPEMTWIPFNDVLCIIILLIALITKKFWVVIGGILGWYISTNQGLFGALGIEAP